MWYFIIKGKPFTATVDLQLQIYWSLAVFIYSFLVHIACSKTWLSSAQYSFEVQIIPFRFGKCRNFTCSSIFLKHGCLKQEMIQIAALPCFRLWEISDVGTKRKFLYVFTKAKIKKTHSHWWLSMLWKQRPDLPAFSKWCSRFLPLMVSWSRMIKRWQSHFFPPTYVLQQKYLKDTLPEITSGLPITYLCVYLNSHKQD